MIEVEGDLFELFDTGYDAIVIPTNGTLNGAGELVMGAGVALGAKKRWPWLPAALAMGRESAINPLKAEGGVRHIVAFRTKNHWRDKARVSLIRRATLSITQWADRYDVKRVILPRVGCGHGGLTWVEVKEILEPFMDNRFHVTRGP